MLQMWKCYVQKGALRTGPESAALKENYIDLLTQKKKIPGGKVLYPTSLKA